MGKWYSLIYEKLGIIDYLTPSLLRSWKEFDLRTLKRRTVIKTAKYQERRKLLLAKRRSDNEKAKNHSDLLYQPLSYHTKCADDC